MYSNCEDEFGVKICSSNHFFKTLQLLRKFLQIASLLCVFLESSNNQFGQPKN